MTSVIETLDRYSTGASVECLEVKLDVQGPRGNGNWVTVTTLSRMGRLTSQLQVPTAGIEPYVSYRQSELERCFDENDLFC